MRQNYKDVVQKNQRKTNIVIFFFILIYMLIGLSGDILFYTFNDYETMHQMDFNGAVKQLLAFQKIPYFTLGLGAVAIVLILVTIALYDKIMLFGTDYVEVNPMESKLTGKSKMVYDIVEEMKIASHLRFMPRVFIVETEEANAFASGYSEKSAMVAVTRGLIERLNRDELQAVIAHEISHIKHLDIKLMLFISVLSNILLVAVDALYHLIVMGGSASKGSKKDGGGNAIIIAHLIILVLRVFLPIVSMVLLMFLSRSREYMADAGAVNLTKDNISLGKALKKISSSYPVNYKEDGGSIRAASYIYNPFKGLSDIFSTHPSLKNRLDSIKYKENE